VLVLGTAAADMLSWHAFRVTIAMALLAARGKEIVRDEVEGVIQCLVRWKTLEALRIYARMNPSTYADYVDIASRNDASLSHVQDVPEIDPSDIIEAHEETLHAMEAMERMSSKSQRPTSHDARCEHTQKKQRDNTHACNASSSTKDVWDTRTFDLGDGVTATDLGMDSWGLVGKRVHIDNSLWGRPDGHLYECTVEGYIGTFKFASRTSKHTYAIMYEGYTYPARHTTVLDGVRDDPALKRRLRKSPPPRAVAS